MKLLYDLGEHTQPYNLLRTCGITLNLLLNFNSCVKFLLVYIIVIYYYYIILIVIIIYYYSRSHEFHLRLCKKNTSPPVHCCQQF